MASRPRARPGSYGRAVANYLRRYPFAPHYRPEQSVAMVTEDGVRLAGARLEGPSDAFATVVLVHGILHSSRTPGVHRFAHLLARHVHVLIPELRGHGASDGLCSFGRDEPKDVAAAVTWARATWPDLPVVTVGISFGGAAVLLHAGMYGGIAGVVGISAPAWWGALETAATRRVHRYATTRAGRVVAARLLGTRIAPRCDSVPDAREVVASISPAFMLIIHDAADHYFGRAHPEALYDWALEPKALWWEEGAGHGTDLLTPSLAERLVAEMRRRTLAGGGPRH